MLAITFTNKAAGELKNRLETMLGEDAKDIMTMNARSLYNFFAERCCARAQWEIRALAEEMLKLVYPVAPALFAKAGPSCVRRGVCPEGKMTCGRAPEVKDHYARLKEELMK